VKPGEVQYIYDPANPVPTIGGNTLYSIPCGPRDQSSLYNRTDIISFISDPFPNGLFICGRLEVILHVSSNVSDTDFTAKLVDVLPDGRNILVQDGIIRMRWRDSETTPTIMAPGSVYKISVDLWSICYVFNYGHKLRLDISSSNYPRFSVNPNTGFLLNELSQNLTAENTIYCSDTQISKLIIDKPKNQSILSSPPIMPEPVPEPVPVSVPVPTPQSETSSAMSLIINISLMVIILCLLS